MFLIVFDHVNAWASMRSLDEIHNKYALSFPEIEKPKKSFFFQCDDDDYGYESNAARAFFDKLMTKYEKKPEDPMDKFTKSGNRKKVTTVSRT